MPGLDIVDRGVNEQPQVVIRLGVSMPGCRIQTAIRWSAPTVVPPRADRRQEEPGRLGAVRPRPQEEVAEVISEAKTEVDVALTCLAAAEEPLGDPLGVLREVLEEAQEALEEAQEDLAVPREARESLVRCQVALGTMTGS